MMEKLEDKTKNAPRILRIQIPPTHTQKINQFRIIRYRKKKQQMVMKNDDVKKQNKNEKWQSDSSEFFFRFSEQGFDKFLLL